MYSVSPAVDPVAWDAFLSRQQYRPFLQSWTMGDVYEAFGQTPIRLVAHDATGAIAGICLAIFVPARRGKHFAVQYGPILSDDIRTHEEGQILYQAFIDALRHIAKNHSACFVRLSPFRPREFPLHTKGDRPSPLHLLAEHLWFLPLKQDLSWNLTAASPLRSVEEILADMRKTTRNLVRRAEKEGVTIEASSNPVADVEHFIRLHDETRKRHGFTPYTNAYFRAQVKAFAPRGECTVYLARYQGEIIAASIHMHAFGETSYHHGASSFAHHKIPASTLLQWQAIQDALRRGDHVYNFWGIAPVDAEGNAPKKHPFAGVTLFKTGFGGAVLHLQPCTDLPLGPRYWLTRGIETLRKWKRGF